MHFAPRKQAHSRRAGHGVEVWVLEVHRMLLEVDRRQRAAASVSILSAPHDLAHDAFVRLAGLRAPLADRQRFARLASSQLRLMLIDRADRWRQFGGGAESTKLAVRFTEGEAGIEVDVLELDQLLIELSRTDARRARVAEMYYFGGFRRDEVAQGMGMPLAAVASELDQLRDLLRTRLAATSPRY